MKIFKSIKWRLQVWYGLILVAVLAALGFTAYQLQRDLLMSRIDSELQRRFGVIADALHGHGPGRGRPPFDRPPSEQTPDYPPPRDQSPGDFLPPEERQPPEFHLPPQQYALFDPREAHQFYYYILDREGKEIGSSTNSGAPFVTITTKLPGEQNTAPDLSSGRVPPPYHFIGHILPSGETIWVGCSIAPEMAALNTTAIKLAIVSAIILFFGLAGGWWISSRAIRPVENISATAVKISAGDLSQRINSADTESELGQLAAVLNSTFARLEASFAQQKQFASDAAHELRTPVSVILTQAQTALNREREAGEYKQTVEACQRAALRMKKLISALLELARLDAGQEQMKRLRFDFSRTITDSIELVRPLADARGIKISTELSPLEIEGDSERLGQVVLNLLTNAIQYNHDGGEVKAVLKPENGIVILAVSDTGQGIPAEDLPRVFERFYRADKSRSSGNAGLGLAICQAIVAGHGGSIDVTSRENAGSTFTVRLPAPGRPA
ncbi:MAG TPA: ATP-binding protein [Candidatus Acidoferrum sp.]|jgi:two-component system OmpR family sensor kinase|nr:ATP-binding protein [Candidatus Acidoferrum sp.]